MAERKEPIPQEDEAGEVAAVKERQTVTRREFLVGAGTGAAATAAVALGTPAQQIVPPAAHPAGPAHTATATPPTLPASMRRVKLNINAAEHEVVVEVRESLWQTMTYQLGMGGSNIGCDRAQCGACTVLIDGRAVNACAVLTARLGRGQKILTVDALATGPGLAGLHPIQRAFWEHGGFQCGICTRGFIMSTYALLQGNKNPTRDQIREALGGNICRCGEYAKIYESVEKAAAAMRGAS